MAGGYKDELPMLLDAHSQLSDDCMDLELQRSNTRSTTRSTIRSASMSMPMNAMGSFDSENYLVSHTGPLRSERRTPFIPMSGPLYSNRKPDNLFRTINGLSGGKTPANMAEEFSSIKGIDQKDWPDDNFADKNVHLLRSGPLGICNDPYCTSCPTNYHFKPAAQKNSKAFESKIQNLLYGDAKGWMAQFLSYLKSFIPGIMNPHAKVVQRWNKFFVISCLVAIFVDPLFFFVLSVEEEFKCIVLSWSLAKTIAVVRSLTDFIFLLHMLLQFRLAYVNPESRVVGAGDLVDHPKEIALHYLRGYFILDVFVVLPLPQIMIGLVLPKSLVTSANSAKNLLRAAVLLQYLPRILRFLPLLAGQSASGFIFESAWAHFIINLLIFVLAGHVVGSCWYLFGLQRVNQCLRDACKELKEMSCKKYIDCGYGYDGKLDKYKLDSDWKNWTNNTKTADCFVKDGPFQYGIYAQAVLVSTKHSIVTRYIYSLFWGFQQISTLAGNQTPSTYVWEVLFTMGIVGLGLLLFALLIGNMQNFLQALGRRKLEIQLRRRDAEQWMRHRRLPEELRRQVRDSERFNWAATQGVNEEALLENLPEDLQREIRRHLFKFVKKVRIFTLMDDQFLDSICQRLRPKLYIGGSKILYRGGPIEKMVFIVRGKMKSIGANENDQVTLSEGHVCGEELLTWCLEHSSVNKDRKKFRVPVQRLLSDRTVLCLTYVEAFALRASDIEEVTALFSRFLRNPRVQGAIRYESPHWRAMAATRIQVAWRYRKKCLSRTASSDHQPNHQRR